MATARFLVGDVFERLAEIPDASVDLVVTSPPFLALRSYLPADHPDKGKEIGSEATPAEFIDTMLSVTAELRRVLAPHGSICVELGDTYAGSGGAGGDYAENGLREGQESFTGSGARRWQAKYMREQKPGYAYSLPVQHGGGRGGGSGWPLAKSRALIPELFRIALAYGINPLTGTESPAGKWLVRYVVTWCRPNPPVGALGDKWRPATSDLVIACTSDRRFWDDFATRRPFEEIKDKRPRPRSGPKQDAYPSEVLMGTYRRRVPGNASGPPLLDWWVIPPKGFTGAHWAVFPPALVEPCVKAMCPQKVCRTCGEPSRQIVSRERINSADDSTRIKNHAESNPSTGFSDPVPEIGWEYDRQTLGFSDCSHDDWRPGLVLDPFCGTGTTLLVATGHGHDAIGIDLDERNAELAMERVGPFMLEVVA